MKTKRPKATVFIPTYNGEKYIGQILGALFVQKVDFAYDVLIIDSGSKDNTLDIISTFQKKHDNLTLKQIPNTEFGHGKTRNYAATLSDAEFIVYLSHDAIPAHDKWLYEMLKPFEISDKVVAVMGKQDPRPGCFPLMKYDIQAVFKGFGPDLGTTLFFHDYFVNSQGVKDFVSFYSDVNSATRRKFLIEEIPYKDVPYSEDQLFGKDVIEAGYMKAYAARGNVQHSNDMALGEYKKRMFDETVGLRRIGNDMNPLSKRFAIRQAIRGIMKNSAQIMVDREYSLKRKMYWLIINPIYQIEKWRGVYRGTNVDVTDKISLEKYSLEKSKAK